MCSPVFLQDIQLNTAPLIVDLDGTLIHTDMLHESALRVSRDRPLDVLRIPLWLLQGKAVLKSQLASRISFDAPLLPYHEARRAWLKEERAAGRAFFLEPGPPRFVIWQQRRVETDAAGQLALEDGLALQEPQRDAQHVQRTVARYPQRGFVQHVGMDQRTVQVDDERCRVQLNVLQEDWRTHAVPPDTVKYLIAKVQYYNRAI